MSFEFWQRNRDGFSEWDAGCSAALLSIGLLTELERKPKVDHEISVMHGSGSMRREARGARREA